MKSEQRLFCSIVLIAQLVMLADGQTGHAQSQTSAGTQPIAQAAEAPLPPEVPGAPPEIICKGDQLKIAGRGSTLSSILRAVHNCTGAKIEVPENVPETRFFDTIGPGPVREVLASLLDDTSFNYIIGSSESDPRKVETITLIARTGDASNDSKLGGPAPSASRSLFTQMRRNYLTAGVPGGNESSTLAEQSATQASEPPAQQSADTPAATQPPVAEQAVPVSGPSETAPPPAQAPAAPQSDASPAPAQTNPVEDQINNMQQLFEQRRQMIANRPQ